VNILGLFAKHWTPGQVKTRLAATIGIEAAADFHAACVRTTLMRLSRLADRSIAVIHPFAAYDDFQSISRPDWEIWPQASGDLGARLREFFAQAFAQGAQRVCVIGADSPDLPREYIDRAFSSLERSEIVLGPTLDGGYYLLGASRVPPNNIFEDIPWSSPQVFGVTLERLAQCSIAPQLLPTWQDVDDWNDLLGLHKRLAEGNLTEPTELKARISRMIRATQK
jgi:hypothetical protein